ncbi:Ubiquitin-like protein pmt3/smt3 [Phytophthora ramorum]|nr:Ubiquitin-like protein pmt3/smt3 [Phytophthora ramorum]
MYGKVTNVGNSVSNFAERNETPRALTLKFKQLKEVMSEEVPPTTDATNGEDKKKAEAITIRVKDQSGEETFFKVKPNTKMDKIFSAYAQRKGVPAAALRFLLDGTRISGDQTPKMLELEDQDQIDCALEQVGGFRC